MLGYLANVLAHVLLRRSWSSAGGGGGDGWLCVAAAQTAVSIPDLSNLFLEVILKVIQ
jgi:hypothetical protein